MRKISFVCSLLLAVFSTLLCVAPLHAQYENGSLVAVPDAQRGRNLEEFVRENQPFLLKLTAEISSVAWGL